MLEETIEHVNIIIKEGIDREDDIQGILKKLLNQIQKQQVEIEKKDKMIDFMLGHIDPFRLPIEEKTTESAKQYFEKKWRNNK